MQTVVPIIHVPDVRATVDWYESIGFQLVRTNEADGKIDWAKLRFGNSELMFNAGGKPNTSHRREVDLYITTDGVDDLFLRVENQTDIIEKPYDTFYGMHEFTIRDHNGFWITFGKPAKKDKAAVQKF